MNIFGTMQTYKNLISAKGIKLAYAYFINCHLFDLTNKTDTHLMVSKNELNVAPEKLKDSLMYMVSWSSTLDKSFNHIKKNFKLSNFEFIDLGSGKGKAALMARESEIVGKSGEKYFGYDFDNSLIEIAKLNSIIMFGDDGKFSTLDVREIQWNSHSNSIVIYMYNPFTKEVMVDVLRALRKKKIILVYCNPVEHSTIQNFGYRLHQKYIGWHPNLNCNIYTNF